MDKALDDALRQALTPDEEADFRLNQTILNQVKEQRTMTENKKTKLSAAAAVAALVLCASSLTAYGAWRYLSSSDVAGNVQDFSLAEAFSGDLAHLINETQNCGDYRVTLLSIVSGESLSAYPHEHNDSVSADRTYAVIAIEHRDGTPMPNPSEAAYAKLEFFASPLIGGYNPALYHIASMSGNYTDMTEDGILYRLVECDNVEIFADHDLYLCVSEGTFYDKEAYRYDEVTGKISRNEDYAGLNVLFSLPADASKANPEKAAEYIAALGVASDYVTEKLHAELEDTFEVKAGEENPQGAEAAEYALQFIGNPFVWGAESLTEGTDSSGFTKSVYAHFGVSLPHSAAAQRTLGTRVEALENAEPGDLIFYETPSHAAIYLGDGMVVHAMPETGICTSEADFDQIEEIRRILDVSCP